MTDVNGKIESFILDSESLGVYDPVNDINTFESTFVRVELHESNYLIKFSIPESEYENFAGDHEIVIMLLDDTGLSRNYSQSIKIILIENNAIEIPKTDFAGVNVTYVESL